MKAFGFVSVLCFLSLNSHALEAPIKLSGEFILQDPVAVSMSWRQEVMDVQTAAGQARYKELLEAGWECEHKSHFEVCRGKAAQDLTANEIEFLQQSASARGPLVFGPMWSEPTIFVEAEAYVEYNHSQEL